MCDLDPVRTTAALRRAGIDRRELERMLRSGVITRARRGVYVEAGACRAQHEAAGHGGRVTCVTAARHLGLWTLTDDPRPHVWLRDGQRAYHRSDGCGCVEHWGDGAPGAAGTRTPIAVVLLHVFRCQGVQSFFVTLESALRRGLVDRACLRTLRLRSNAPMREALELARSDADSGLESLLRWRLRDWGLRIRTQVTIAGVGRIDALIGDQLIIETDGRLNHDGDTLRHKDLVRDAHAAAWGYVTLRFDYALIVHDWPLVEDAIRGALTRLAQP